jgi:LmbE family N-acetylglucosaminyl deacetylase
MFIDSMKSVLIVGAHPDDVEWMAGGTIASVVSRGGRVHALTFTDGSWTNESNQQYRKSGVGIEEAKAAAAVLGYSVEHLGEPTLDLAFKDSLVVEVLRRVESRSVDTIICPWLDDLHHDHEIAARLAISASRRVPRVLMGMCNWYICRGPFSPNIFVDVSETFHLKMSALECYKSEMTRVGDTWRAFHDATSKNYGLIAGVARAEGFVTNKFLL